jgi:hypothetical protein
MTVQTRASSDQKEPKFGLSIKKLREKRKKLQSGVRNRSSSNCVRGEVNQSENSVLRDIRPKCNMAFQAISPFSKADPESWFRQLEAIFTISEVTDNTLKFVHVQARLDPTILREIADFLAQPPEADKYNAIKKKLINKYADSRDHQVLQLLEKVTLGDRKPSEVLADMRRLAGTDISEQALQTMFLNKLPPSMAGILAGSSESLTKIGELADRIQTFSPSTGHGTIAAIQTNETIQRTPHNSDQLLKTVIDQLSGLRTQLAQYDLRLARMEAENSVLRSSYRSRSQERDSNRGTRTRSNSRERFEMPEDLKLCYYHYQFMSKAKKCKSLEDGTPCKWSSLNP